MNLDRRIINRLQEIASIFVQKGIPAMPIRQEYLELEINPDTEKLLLKELLYDLEDLLKEYLDNEHKLHKYNHYLFRFRDLLKDNTTEEGRFVGKPIKKRRF